MKLCAESSESVSTSHVENNRLLDWNQKYEEVSGAYPLKKKQSKVLVYAYLQLRL